MSYDQELTEFRRILDEMTVVGHLRRDAELAELHRLIGRYPDEAREMCAKFDGAYEKPA
ncbi:hypothetical protein NE236_39915 [Actinoallomurus purpureus]|uniref:hypothetical protein n=1 Tax=Actinoallomurus purpureus TaxID=478114 RepID=UPI002092C245|nr:hypothetical protein [Actinoallomurus purpureus]MCO6011141.1 hypothetical protein [Actinoallomurus purpureus]